MRSLDQSTNFIAYFDYSLNTTICGDSDKTICPGPNNQTCCDNHQGITEINYYNQDAIPTNSTNPAALSSYYAAGDYISTSSSSSSTSPSSASPSSASPSSKASHSANPSSSPASGLSGGSKAGIGIGVALGAVSVAAALLYLFYRHKQNSRGQHGQGDGHRELEHMLSDVKQSGRTDLDSVHMSDTSQRPYEMPS